MCLLRGYERMFLGIYFTLLNSFADFLIDPMSIRDSLPSSSTIN